MKYYTEDHEWVEISGEEATVGISEYAADELGEITYVELPEEDDDFIIGDRLGEVESVKASSDIYSPISGTVSQVNEALADEPGLVNESPEEKGWLCRLVNFDSSELDDMIFLILAFLSFLRFLRQREPVRDFRKQPLRGGGRGQRRRQKPALLQPAGIRQESGQQRLHPFRGAFGVRNQLGGSGFRKIAGVVELMILRRIGVGNQHRRPSEQRQLGHRAAAGTGDGQVGAAQKKLHLFAAFQQQERKIRIAVGGFRLIQLLRPGQVQHLKLEPVAETAQRFRQHAVENRCALTAAEDQNGRQRRVQRNAELPAQPGDRRVAADSGGPHQFRAQRHSGGQMLAVAAFRIAGRKRRGQQPRPPAEKPVRPADARVAVMVMTRTPRR